MRPLKPRIAGLCTGPILCKVMIIAIALLAFSLVYQSNAFSQSKSRQEARLLKKARKLLAEINYREAKEVYEKLISTDSNNVHYNFEQGICYYNSYVDRDKSIRYFERALANMASDSIGEVFYYLGRVYHYVGRFEDAIREYNNFKQFILHNKPGMVLQRDVERYMEMCRNGIRYYEALNSSIKITNLGSEVNSPYPEYAPVINPGETTLLFAARKKGSTGNRFYHDDKYYEDIYFSSLEDDEWSKPSKFDSTDEHISSRINTRKHEAPIIYSEDGQKLFIYRKNHVWISRFENSKWTKPVKLNANVNSRGMGAHEPSAYMTSDEKTLFITSNRKGGFGGRDIWKSEKQEDGSWGPVQNLGQLINTIYDEDAPFVSPDGKTLYFSSNGHKTMGGYDIFASKWDSVNAQWSEPVNLGAPINTPADDIYYITDEREEDGYYASSMQGGYGDMDIYHIQLSCENIPFTEVRGLVVAGKSRIPVGAAIRVSNKETGEDMGTFHSDPHTGKYLMVLPPENTYDLELATDGYEYKHRETFTIPKQCDYYQLFQEIQVSYLRDSSGRIFAQKGHFHDAFFDARQKAAELFLLDSLVVTQGAEKDTAVPLLVLTGIIKHNETAPARGIRVGVMGDGDTVYAKTLSDESGIWRVENLSARKQYTLLINGYDLQKQYYGTDTIEKSVIVNGKVFYSALPDDDHNPPFTPVARMQVALTDNSGKTVNVSRTDTNGGFDISNIPADVQMISQFNAAHHITEQLEIPDPDQYLSAYIKSLDKDTTSLNYSEYIDLVYIEQVPETIQAPPEIIVFKNILFDFDKSDLRSESRAELDKINAYMSAHEDVLVEIHGHTDRIGTEAYNIELSKRRAIAAVNYLKTASTPESRIEFRYFGESMPVVSGTKPDGSDDPLGRQLNRRCEFRFSPTGHYTSIVMNF